MAAAIERPHSPTNDWTDFVHTGPGTLAGRYLRGFWMRSSRAGDVFPDHPRLMRDGGRLS